MHQRSPFLHRADGDPLHDGIAPAHLSLGIDGNDRLLHAVEQRGQFAATTFERVEALLQAARSHVERMGDGRDFIQIALFDPGRQIAGSDAIGEHHDAAEAFGDPLRQQGRQQGRDDEREQGRHARYRGAVRAPGQECQGGNKQPGEPPAGRQGRQHSLCLRDGHAPGPGADTELRPLRGARNLFLRAFPELATSRPWASKMPTSTSAAAASVRAICCKSAGEAVALICVASSRASLPRDSSTWVRRDCSITWRKEKSSTVIPRKRTTTKGEE